MKPIHLSYIKVPPTEQQKITHPYLIQRAKETPLLNVQSLNEMQSYMENEFGTFFQTQENRQPLTTQLTTSNSGWGKNVEVLTAAPANEPSYGSIGREHNLVISYPMQLEYMTSRFNESMRNNKSFGKVFHELSEAGFPTATVINGHGAATIQHAFKTPDTIAVSDSTYKPGDDAVLIVDQLAGNQKSNQMEVLKTYLTLKQLGYPDEAIHIADGAKGAQEIVNVIEATNQDAPGETSNNLFVASFTHGLSSPKEDFEKQNSLTDKKPTTNDPGAVHALILGRDPLGNPEHDTLTERQLRDAVLTAINDKGTDHKGHAYVLLPECYSGAALQVDSPTKPA